MKLYNQLIYNCMALLEQDRGKRLQLEDAGVWQDVGKHNLILKQEMAYELGGGTSPSVSGLMFTSDAALVEQDEILLYGPDLPELTKNVPYARLTFLRAEADALGKGNQMYEAMKRIGYTRYHVNPFGYMMRISSAREQEPVRIGKQALDAGLDFAKAGKLFLEGYRKHPEVSAVKIIYITRQDFPYRRLEALVRQADQITESLNELFQNLKMDCSVCGLKAVCDEVEGMRELHFSQKKR